MRARRCPGGCNRTTGGDADYPTVREPYRCKLFHCLGCRRYRPWCNGSSETDLCDACWCKANPAATRRAS